MPPGTSISRIGTRIAFAALSSGFPANKIRRIDAQTRVITRIAGTGDYTFNRDGLSALATNLWPGDLAFDPSGSLAFVDVFSHRIRRIDSQTGIVSTILGNGKLGDLGDLGLATDAQTSANAISFDQQGNLYVSSGNRVREVYANTGMIAATPRLRSLSP